MRKAAPAKQTYVTTKLCSAPAKFVYIRKSTMHREPRGTSDRGGFVDSVSLIILRTLPCSLLSVPKKTSTTTRPSPPSPESKYQAAATFFGAGRPDVWGAATFPSQPQLAAATTKTCGGSDFDCAHTQKYII